MEEDIKILEEILNRDIEDTEGTKIMKKAIRNLIAGYKELEEKVKTLKSLSNDYNRLWIEKCEEYNSLERKIEKINELNIPVETLIAEFNRLEDLEDDRDCNYIPKSKVKEKIEELDYNDIGNFERRCKQEVLQSLLEKE